MRVIRTLCQPVGFVSVERAGVKSHVFFFVLNFEEIFIMSEVGNHEDIDSYNLEASIEACDV